MGMGMIIDLLEAGDLLALAAPDGGFYYAQKVDAKRQVWDFVTSGEASTVDGHTGNPADAVVVLLKSNDQKFIGFRSHVAEGKILQATKDKGLILRFSNQNFDSWEQWAVYGESLDNCLLVNRKFPDKRFHVAFHKVLPVLESSFEATKDQLVRAQAEAAAAKLKQEASDKRTAELEAQIADGNSTIEAAEAAAAKSKQETSDKRIAELEVQIADGNSSLEAAEATLEARIEELEAELKKAKEELANVDDEDYVLVRKEQKKATMSSGLLLWSELDKTEKELEEANATVAHLREMLAAAVEKATKDAEEDKVVSWRARVAQLEEELNASKESVIAIEDRTSLELERALSLHQSQAHRATEAMLALESKVRELVKKRLEDDNRIDVLENVVTKQSFELEIVWVLQDSQMKDVSATVTGSEARNIELEKELQSYVAKESRQAQRLEAAEEIIAQRDETVRQLRDNAIELQGLIAAARQSSDEEKSDRIAVLQSKIKELETEVSSSRDRAKVLAEKALELESLSSERQCVAENAAGSAASLQELLAVAHDTNAEMNANMTEMQRKLSLLEVQCGEAEENASQKAAEVDAILARAHLSSAKLEEAEAASMELQSRVVSLQERADRAEAQYRTALESLAKSREDLGHLQTFTAQLTHEKQQLETKVQQMTTTLVQENASLISQMAVLRGQLQENQTKVEADSANAATSKNRKSFREVTLDGELQALRAQASELTLLRSQLIESENRMHEAEARQRRQNMSLVQEQQRLTAAQQEISSLKDKLINHSSHKQISELQGIVTSLEEKLMTAETQKTKLKNKYKELCSSSSMAEGKKENRTSEGKKEDGTSEMRLLAPPLANANQPKANITTQEGVKSVVVSQTGKTRKRKPKTDKSTDEQTAALASVITQKVDKPLWQQHKVGLVSLLVAVLIAIALARIIYFFKDRL